jgi:hypothetical protein
MLKKNSIEIAITTESNCSYFVISVSKYISESNLTNKVEYNDAVQCVDERHFIQAPNFHRAIFRRTEQLVESLTKCDPLKKKNIA